MKQDHLGFFLWPHWIAFCFFFMGVGQMSGEWIGIALGKVRVGSTPYHLVSHGYRRYICLRFEHGARNSFLLGRHLWGLARGVCRGHEWWPKAVRKPNYENRMQWKEISLCSIIYWLGGSANFILSLCLSFPEVINNSYCIGLLWRFRVHSEKVFLKVIGTSEWSVNSSIFKIIISERFTQVHLLQLSLPSVEIFDGAC